MPAIVPVPICNATHTIYSIESLAWNPINKNPVIMLIEIEREREEEKEKKMVVDYYNSIGVSDLSHSTQITRNIVNMNAFFECMDMSNLIVDIIFNAMFHLSCDRSFLKFITKQLHSVCMSFFFFVCIASYRSLFRSASTSLISCILSKRRVRS